LAKCQCYSWTTPHFGRCLEFMPDMGRIRRKWCWLSKQSCTLPYYVLIS
jgi:hypothetical protein